jgi:hypothetical protein
MDEGRIDALIAALSEHADRSEEARKCAGYFTRNRPRMDYPTFESMGLCVGSGVVEAALQDRGGRAHEARRDALDRPGRERHRRLAVLPPQRALRGLLGMEGGARSREGGVRARLTVPHHDPGVRPRRLVATLCGSRALRALSTSTYPRASS